MSELSQIVSWSDLYNSPEAFQEYLADVRARRSARRERLREHWRNALEQLLPEWEAAQAEHDDELAAELADVIDRFRLLVDSPQPDPLPYALVSSEVSVPAIAIEELLAPESTATPVSLHAVITADTPPVEPPFENVPALCEQSEAEQTARQDEDRHAIETLIADIQDHWQTLDAEGLLNEDKTLSRSRCFRLRALLARLCAARACAELSGLSRDFARTLGGLRDSLCVRREIDRDRSESFVYVEENWIHADAVMAVDQWLYLAEDYERVALAQQAMDWYLAQGADCPPLLREPLLNAVGAAATLLSDSLGNVNGKDKFHQLLYQAVADNASEFFLPGIAPETPIETLVDLAQRLPEVWDNARQITVRKMEQSDKEARRQDALQAVVDLCAEPEFGSSNSRVDADRPRLLPLLDACKKASIPASNPLLREALMTCAPFLLSGQSGYLTFLNEVNKEKNRRQSEQRLVENSGDQDVNDPDFDRFVDAVRPHCEGKTMLILGGERSLSHVAEELQRLLSPAAIDWMPAHRVTSTAKYQSPIRKHDITCLLISFMSHELSQKGRKWAEEAGKCAAVIDKGYGSRRIVKGLYEHFFGNAAAEAMGVRR